MRGGRGGQITRPPAALSASTLIQFTLLDLIDLRFLLRACSVFWLSSPLFLHADRRNRLRLASNRAR